MTFVDQLTACAAVGLLGGWVGVIAGFIAAVFLIAIFNAARSADDVIEALDVPPTEEELTVEDAIRAGVIRGFMEGTVSDRGLPSDQRVLAARRLASDYIDARRKFFHSARAAKPQPVPQA